MRHRPREAQHLEALGRRRLLCALGVALVSVMHTGVLGAEEPSGEAPVVEAKTKEGLHFTLPPDWPVEKRGGLVAPIPIEEYLGTKFKNLDAKLQRIEQRLNGLDIRFRVLEQAVQSQQPTGLRSTEALNQ